MLSACRSADGRAGSGSLRAALMRFVLRHPTWQREVLAVGFACAALSALSLVLPYWLSKDEWSWLVWGREVRQLDLQLAAGTVWKPLPVLFTIFVSGFGPAAPYLWLAVVRAGWLLALVAGYRVGAHLGGRAAGLLGAGALLLIPAQSEWLAYFGRGSAEPLIVACLLWAIDRHIHGRRLQALALASLAALGRPEPWPLVVAYGALVWRREGALGRVLVLALVAMVPALWLGGSWWGEGNPLPRSLHTASWSEVSGSVRGLAAVTAGKLFLFGRYLARFAIGMVILPVWVAAAFAVLRALRAARPPGDEKARLVVALGVAALVWAAIVIGDLFLGLPLASRFLFGPATLVSILGGVGIAQAVQAVTGWRRAALAVAIAVATLPFAVDRAAQLTQWMPRGDWSPFSDPSWAEVLERAQASNRLGACGDEIHVRDRPSASDPRARAGKFARFEIAFRLGARLDWVKRLGRRHTPTVHQGLVLAPVGIPQLPPHGAVTSSAREATRDGRWRRTAAANGWAVYEVGCRLR